MSDWVEILLKDAEIERQRADMWAELRLRQLRIGKIVGPQTWDAIERRIESDVKSLRAGSSDPAITYTHTAGGFVCLTREYPRVSLTFNATDPLIAPVEYGYGAVFNNERSWVRNVEVKFDEKDNHYLVFDGRRFDTVAQIAAALLAPLADRKFVPPEA